MLTATEKPNVKAQNRLISRPPVVVVLGHIDHGKTRLLDAIHKTNVVDKESGGITQHIGASEILHSGKKITFIDTPGHEAFSAMRSRGAHVADVGILVVAADEGVKPQTQEAIRILQETKTPFVVAINKIDKPEANVNLVKQQLAENGVLVETYGGQIPVQEISAKAGQGINELLDLVLLVAELENLQADPLAPASGVILESHLDPKRGNVATLLITNGVLHRGDFVAAETVSGKIRILEDFKSQPIDSASFSSPVLVVGFEKLPPLGAKFQSFASKAELENYLKLAVLEPTAGKSAAIDTAQSKTSKKILPLVIKADTQGSLEAIEKTLQELKYDEVYCQILSSAVGDVNENDVKTAAAASGKKTILAFRVKIPAEIAALAAQHKVDLISAEVIYKLLDEIKAKLQDLLEPEIKRNLLGKLKILALFKGSQNFQIVGAKVLSGLVRSGAKIAIFRDNKEIGQGTISQLQQNKLNVNEVVQDKECGLQISGLPGGVKIEIGDTLEVFEEEVIKKELK